MTASNLVCKLFVSATFILCTLINYHLVDGIKGSPSPSVLGNFNPGTFKYEAPDDCQWTVRQINGNDEVSLTCHLRTINSEFDSTNFSVIPGEHTTALKVDCNPDLHSKSSLPEKSFSHLTKLREFQLTYCKLKKWDRDTLLGLPDLRNLTLQSHNTDWPLEISPLSLIHVKQLEKLDLSFNNLWTFPDELFCPLTNLFTLNVSHNHLHDVTDFGFHSLPVAASAMMSPNLDTEIARQELQKVLVTSTEASIIINSTERNLVTTVVQKSSCNLDIQILDISHNSFKQIPSRGLSTLKRLQELRLNNNELTSIADKALNGLKNLRILDLSNNQLVALPSMLFKDCGEIRELHMQNNSLGALPPELFSGLKHLLLLDLSRNRLSSSWLDSNTFSGLIRLVLLDLSHNRIARLDPEFFRDLYTLQILNLEHNLLETLAQDTFAPMNNLHTLVLSYNKLKKLEPYALNGLFALSLLSLDNNLLQVLHEDSFKNCSSLQDLNLNGNLLTNVPSALQDMRLLRTVDLGENTISQLDEPGFRGMNNLYGLRLIGNQLTNLSRLAFAQLPTLQILNLARNKIQKIEMSTFDLNVNLQAIRLDANLLTDVNGLFTKLPNLVWLNISDNQLTWFDYSLVPSSLQWLDLHKNKIKEIADSKRRISNGELLKLQTLDMSYNLLTRVGPNSIPASVEMVFLNDNSISYVETHTFVGKPNLTRVDLYANQIVAMDLNALRLSAVNDDKPLPEFYIGGNPFKCDCTMEWLQRINTLDHLRQHPKVMDLESVYCRLPYSRERQFIPLIEAESSHFVCAYTAHCFAICHCCEFDACDCKMTCPTNCTCYHDQTWSAANIVDCSNSNHVRLPGRIPMDATEVYLDGNKFGELTSHSFIGRKNLRTLYVNNSQVAAIHNHTFSGLKRLQILHLEDNFLKELRGFEFSCLEELREIYLHNNRLVFIDNRTFTDLQHLEVLRLDNNRLFNFPVWQFMLNPYLVRVTLSDNNWSCHCRYIREYRQWLKSNIAKVTDASRVTCVLRIQTGADSSDAVLKKQLGPHMNDFNSTACSSFLIGNGYLDSVYYGDDDHTTFRAISDYFPVILAIVVAFLFVTCLIFGFTYHRKKVRSWVYTQCSRFKCYSSTARSCSGLEELQRTDDRARLYDAYVTYSVKDELFVSQVLASGLEPQYRLCLHYRDFSVGSYVADTIVEAVESSKRTIIVLSSNFLNSEWCRFEFKSALREALQRDSIRCLVPTRHLGLKSSSTSSNSSNIVNKRLIVILLGDIPPRELDPDIRVYLNKTAITCVKWGDKRFWDKLKHVLPTESGSRLLISRRNHHQRENNCNRNYALSDGNNSELQFKATAATSDDSSSCCYKTCYCCMQQSDSINDDFITTSQYHHQHHHAHANNIRASVNSDHVVYEYSSIIGSTSPPTSQTTTDHYEQIGTLNRRLPAAPSAPASSTNSCLITQQPVTTHHHHHPVVGHVHHQQLVLPPPPPTSSLHHSLKLLNTSAVNSSTLRNSHGTNNKHQEQQSIWA